MQEIIITGVNQYHSLGISLLKASNEFLEFVPRLQFMAADILASHILCDQQLPVHWCRISCKWGEGICEGSSGRSLAIRQYQETWEGEQTGKTLASFPGPYCLQYLMLPVCRGQGLKDCIMCGDGI